jgi:hypothetical protein
MPCAMPRHGELAHWGVNLCHDLRFAPNLRPTFFDRFLNGQAVTVP